ncbi:MAG: sodium-dependent transporter [Bacteroidales bacterium]|nr:sodium-dependent transporter [Bacteroidales bacterium]
MSNSTQSNTFSSNLGAILAAVGSAVGLGNIWRFPYICGKYGGGAFLLVYLLFIFGLGMTMMMAEFIIGRHTKYTPSKALPAIAPKHPTWRYVGHFGILTAFLTLSLYWVISGWTSNYLIDACTGTMSRLGTDATAVIGYFNGFVSSAWAPIACLSVFGVVAMIIIMGGVQKGIEGVSKILMPVLVLLLLVLCVHSLTLPGATKGISYLLVPDFSKLNSEAILAALGQALFSLSVGIGMMIVYGGYLPKNDNILKTTFWITISDCLIAILAGIAIFPAVFSSGMEPAEGAGLVFKVLPIVFNDMGGIGQAVAIIFFLLLVVAALTSAISLLEYLCVWLTEVLHIGRKVSALICTIATVGVGAVLSLSNGLLSDITLFDKSLFSIADLLSGTYLFPLCALGISIFFGWFMPIDDISDELSNHGTISIRYFKVFYFLLRYIVPLALIVVFASSIL